MICSLSEHFTLADYDKLLYVMQPSYPLTTGLTEKMVVKSVHQVIDGGQVYVPEYLPEDMRREYDLESEWDAVRQVHFPVNEQVMRQSRKRIVFDEFLLFILGTEKHTALPGRTCLPRLCLNEIK